MTETLTMHLGLRPRVHFPASYKGFQLLRTHGRVFAVPPPLDPEELLKKDHLFIHPAALSAATLEEVQALIDRFDAEEQLPQKLDAYRGYDLVRFRGALFAVRQSAGQVDLDLADDRRRGGVLTGGTLEELRRLIREAGEGEPVEFAGWLPIFEFSGRCGRHPQFAHTGEPPQGYRFTCSAPPKGPPSWLAKKAGAFFEAAGEACVKAFLAVRPIFATLFGGPRVGLRARMRVLGAVARLGGRLLRRGCRVIPVLKFLQSRHFHSQLLLERSKGLVFLTSMPYTYGQRPWVVEIEDPTTLFYPLIQNGHTAWLDLPRSPYFPIVKTLLESDSCKGILTHMRSTAKMVPTLFGSDAITKKVHYAPLGVKLPTRWQRHDEEKDPDEIHLLFINSWCQIPENFYVRGGLDLLEAFATLRVRYPQLRLTLRTALPALSDHYQRILEGGDVTVISRFLTAEELAALHARSHIYLLPAARVHIVSLLQAMSYGLATVVSDGWGFDEYVEHQRNGLVVKGRYGKVTWADEQVGMLRENYEPTYTPDPEVTEGLIEAVSRLVEDRALRARLGRAGRADVEAKYTLARWNEGLRAALDKARGGDGIVWASHAIRDVEDQLRPAREAARS